MNTRPCYPTENPVQSVQTPAALQIGFTATTIGTALVTGHQRKRWTWRPKNPQTMVEMRMTSCPWGRIATANFRQKNGRGPLLSPGIWSDEQLKKQYTCSCVCVCACVRACVRVRVCVCVCACALGLYLHVKNNAIFLELPKDLICFFWSKAGPCPEA